MLKKLKFIFLFVVLLSIPNAFAQEAGINFLLGFPQGEFLNKVDRLGIGLGGELSYRFSPRYPFSLGLNFGYMNYGSETRQVPLSTYIPDIVVNVNRSNNLVNFHLLFKVMPSSGVVRPYVDLLVGGAYLWTETSLTQRYQSQNETKLSDTNLSDFAFSYGAGGGFMFQVYEEATTKIFVDLKGRYLNGSNAQYLTEGSISISDGKAFYNISKSRTDLVMGQIGVYLFFM